MARGGHDPYARHLWQNVLDGQSSDPSHEFSNPAGRDLTAWSPGPVIISRAPDRAAIVVHTVKHANYPASKLRLKKKNRGSNTSEGRSVGLDSEKAKKILLANEFDPGCRDLGMKATWNGTTIAESDDTVIVEGNHYFPIGAIKNDYLRPSDTRSSCPWKGQASYCTLEVDGQKNADAA